MWILVLSLKSALLGQPHGAAGMAADSYRQVFQQRPRSDSLWRIVLGLHRAELARQEVRQLPSGIKIPVNFQNKTPSTDLGSCQERNQTV